MSVRNPPLFPPIIRFFDMSRPAAKGTGCGLSNPRPTTAPGGQVPSGGAKEQNSALARGKKRLCVPVGGLLVANNNLGGPVQRSKRCSRQWYFSQVNSSHSVVFAQTPQRKDLQEDLFAADPRPPSPQLRCLSRRDRDPGVPLRWRPPSPSPAFTTLRAATETLICLN